MYKNEQKFNRMQITIFIQSNNYLNTYKNKQVVTNI